jgi:hypothetical protein
MLSAVRLRAGLDAGRATGSKVREPQWLALLAEACLAARRIEEGLSAVREALAEVEETAARYYEAELNRLEGELRLAAEEPDESRAEASFCKAIEIAGDQGAKSFELRAAASLARLLARQGRRGEARGLLAPEPRPKQQPSNCFSEGSHATLVRLSFRSLGHFPVVHGVDPKFLYGPPSPRWARSPFALR